MFNIQLAPLLSRPTLASLWRVGRGALRGWKEVLALIISAPADNFKQGQISDRPEGNR
jgi:hypothetical protein